jgi:hypothetical protein
MTRMWRVPAVVALAVFPLYLSTLAPGLTWIHHSADSGDLITAAATGGVAHPSGYPTYLLLARAALLVPVGSLAFRTNLLSAVCAALAAGLVAALVARSYGGRGRFGQAGGALAGLGFGLSPLLWSQAVVTEVYALHALLVACLLATLPGARGKWWPAGAQLSAGALFGLALGNHLTIGLLLPAWLAATAWQDGRLHARPALERLAGLAAGLLVYLVLPLRAAAHAPVNWANAVTLDRLWWLISGAPYRALAFGLPPSDVPGRVQALAGLLVAQFGGLGLAVALFGLFFGRVAARRVHVVTGWVAAAFSVFALTYWAPDSDAYLIPAFLAVAVWLGLGAATALEALRARPAARLALAGLLGVALLWNAVGNLPRVDASQATEAEVFGRAVMAGAPPGALLLAQADRDAFSLWYFHFALGQRPDVAVIVEPLLAFDWYRDNLGITEPALVIPTAPGAGWRAAIQAVNPSRPLCTLYPDAEVPLACWPLP